LIHLPLLFINISCTFIDASAGARHLAHGCVATLEKGLAHQTMAIACELRLAVNQMTNSHW